MARLKNNVPARGVVDVGKGDFVNIGKDWKRITSNSAEGSDSLPKNWTVTTEDGRSYGMFFINRYAKAEDLED